MTGTSEQQPANRSVRQEASDAARRAGRFGKQVNRARVNAWHPALEPSQSVEPPKKGRIDYVVFGITAAVSIGFVLW